MPDSRNQRVSNDHPAYSLNLIIDSEHPGLLDSSGQFIVPSLFSFEQNGEFIPGYPGINMDKPPHKQKFLFTVRDLAGDKKLTINSWKITMRDDKSTSPFPLTFPVTSEKEERTVIATAAGKSYFTYTLLETTFLSKEQIDYQSCRFTMQLNVSKNGEQGVLLFASDPEMIIEDETGGGAARGASA